MPTDGFRGLFPFQQLQLQFQLNLMANKINVHRFINISYRDVNECVKRGQIIHK